MVTWRSTSFSEAVQMRCQDVAHALLRCFTAYLLPQVLGGLQELVQCAALTATKALALGRVRHLHCYLLATLWQDPSFLDCRVQLHSNDHRRCDSAWQYWLLTGSSKA
jgi:hypothetical protein